jgi:putative component of toxin-antitoxin plasmid stabilization module
MTLNVEISSAKLRELNERAKQIGVSPEKLAGRMIDMFVDVSQEDLDGWIETLELLSDRDFSSRLQKSIEQAQDGEVVDWKDVKRELGMNYTIKLTNTATKMLEEISDRRIRKKIGERIDELANDPELQGNL